MYSTASTLREMETELIRWGTRMDELEADVDRAGEGVNIEYRERLHSLKSKHDSAQSKLDALRGSHHHKWARFRTGTTRAWHEFTAAFKELKH